MSMSDKRTYSEEFIAHALSVLKANNDNAKDTAKQLGVPRTTLRQWAGRAKSATARPKQVSIQIQDKSDEVHAQRLGAVFMLATEPELVASKLEKASLRDLLIASDIATRGRALLRGLPTSREGREVRIIFSADSGAGSLRELAERTMSGTRSLPEPPLEGEVVATQD